MEKRRAESAGSTDLRVKAEEKAARQTGKLREPAAKDAKTLIHELQVHQIELEMQNEELRRAQVELERSRANYCELYDFAPVGYFTISDKGIILEANLTAAALLLAERQDLLGSPLSRFVVEGDADRFYLHWREVLASGTRQACDIKMVKKNGSEFYAQLVSSPPQDDKEGKFTRLRTAVVDITDRVEAQHKVLEYQAQLKGLASELSLAEERERRRIARGLHDNIAQRLLLAKLQLQSPLWRQCTAATGDYINDACATLDDVINDIQSLTFELSSPALYELSFDAAVDKWLEDQVRNKYDIDCHLTSGREPIVLDDTLKVTLFQAVRELLTNVVKHAQAATVNVGIGTVAGTIQVTVEDDGIGFDTSKAHSPAHTDERGGFGLFSVRERMQYIGGDIDIQSSPGNGTRVTLRLPPKKL